MVVEKAKQGTSKMAKETTVWPTKFGGCATGLYPIYVLIGFKGNSGTASK
jgi:hypothetical protein